MTRNSDKSALTLAGLMLAATLSLGACNTVAGAGQDIESVGEEIEETANEVNRKI